MCFRSTGPSAPACFSTVLRCFPGLVTGAGTNGDRPSEKESHRLSRNEYGSSRRPSHAWQTVRKYLLRYTLRLSLLSDTDLSGRASYAHFLILSVYFVRLHLSSFGIGPGQAFHRYLDASHRLSPVAVSAVAELQRPGHSLTLIVSWVDGMRDAASNRMSRPSSHGSRGVQAASSAPKSARSAFRISQGRSRTLGCTACRS
jgi:hypothetical protein